MNGTPPRFTRLTLLILLQMTAFSDSAFTDHDRTLIKKAESGDASAQYNLGVAYQHGQGVPLDYVEAAKWYRKAAEQGHWMAQYELGVAHYHGRGVQVDYSLAYFWMALSAMGSTGEQCVGIAKAQDEISLMLTPEQLQKTEQMILEWEKNHPR